MSLDSFFCLCQVCELGEQLEQEKAHCEGLVRKDQLAVDQFFHRLQVALAKKRDAYLGVLDDANTEISQVYNPLINRIKEIQVCVKSSVSKMVWCNILLHGLYW